MRSSNELAKVESGNGRAESAMLSRADSMMDWQTMREQANVLVKSGFLPKDVNTPEKALAIMLTARELGIGQMEAFRSVSVIQGKPTISPQLMLALARRTKELEDIQFEEPKTGCTVTVKRRGQAPFSTTFGDAEAKAMELSNKSNYAKQKGTMYRWRALAANLRITFPDAICGLYTPEELGASTDDDGNLVEATVTTKEVVAPKKPVITADSSATESSALKELRVKVWETAKAKGFSKESLSLGMDAARAEGHNLPSGTGEATLTQLNTLLRLIEEGWIAKDGTYFTAPEGDAPGSEAGEEVSSDA